MAPRGWTAGSWRQASAYLSRQSSPRPVSWKKSPSMPEVWLSSCRMVTDFVWCSPPTSNSGHTSMTGVSSEKVPCSTNCMIWVAVHTLVIEPIWNRESVRTGWPVSRLSTPVANSCIRPSWWNASAAPGTPCLTAAVLSRSVQRAGSTAAVIGNRPSWSAGRSSAERPISVGSPGRPGVGRENEAAGGGLSGATNLGGGGVRPPPGGRRGDRPARGRGEGLRKAGTRGLREARTTGLAEVGATGRRSTGGRPDGVPGNRSAGAPSCGVSPYEGVALRPFRLRSRSWTRLRGCGR